MDLAKKTLARHKRACLAIKLASYSTCLLLILEWLAPSLSAQVINAHFSGQGTTSNPDEIWNDANHWEDDLGNPLGVIPFDTPGQQYHGILDNGHHVPLRLVADAAVIEDLTGLTIGSNSGLLLQNGDQLTVALAVNVDGKIEATGVNTLFLSQRADPVFDDARLIATNAAEIDLESTSYALSSYPGALTLWQADGASSVLRLDALESISTAVGIGGTEINYTIEAANGGLIDVSNVTSVTGAISNDWLRFHLHDGGVLNFASLNTTTGRIRFDLDQAYTLPSLQSTTSTVFELAPGITASMPSLSTFRSGFFVPETGSTFSAPLLANFTDSSLNLDGTWTFSTSQPLLDIDDSFIVATNGQTLTVADPAYNLTHYPGSATLLKADGAGSALDLSSVASINTAVGIGGGVENYTIEATDGGSIDLSGVSSLTGAISNDWLRFKLNAGGSLDLTSLQTVTGRTKFDIDQFFTLPALETISSSRFELGSFSTFNTPMLESFHGGAITGESGSEYNAAKLLSFTDSQVTIDSTWQFDVPLFEDIDDSFITVNDGESFAVADTSYNITHYPGDVTLMRADGSGSLLDLSSVASVSAAVGVGGSVINYTIEAANNGTIDLSGTTSVTGATSNDWLRFLASQGGDLELGDVSASGRAYFRVSDNNSKMRFASLQLTPPVYLEALLNGSVLIDSILEGVGNPSVILDQANFGSMTIGTGPEETTLNTIRVHADGAIKGDITLAANLANDGTVSPGASAGTITVNGDYTQGLGGSFHAEPNDQLICSGQVALAGELLIQAGEFTPGIDHEIITGAAVSGTFASSNASALGLVIIYQPDRVLLRVAADGDGDGLPDLWETTNIGDLTEDGADDHDNDGLTNAEELAQFTDPDSADSDMDGLDDGDEVNTHGTDPRVADSDSDGLNDGAEINNHGTNPNLADSDGDGLEDGTEVNTHGSNPTLADSDLDGVDDGVEVGRGGHPTDPGITPLWQTQTALFTGGDPGEGLDFSGIFPYAVNMRGSGGFTIDDASFTDDSSIIFSAPSETLNWHLPEYGSSTRDNDLETIMQSIRYSTGIITLDLPGLDPGYGYKVQLLFAESTSNRGFDVEAEGFTIVDDLNPGQEQGGINITNNGVVVSHTFEALDSVLNLRLTDDVPFPDNTPVLFGFTLENLGPIDSDGDGLPDRWEMEHFGNLAQGAADNPDNDGLDNASELSQGTDPDDADSDNDTLTDGDEVLTHGTNPLEPDSDFDGFDDNTELADGTSPTDFYDQPTVIPVTDATYTGPTNPGLYDNPANWDINAIPLDAVNARYHSIINSAGTVNLSDVTPVNGLVTGLTMSSDTTLQLGPNDQLVVDIPVNIDGRITSSGSNALFRSQGGGGTFNDAKLFVDTAGVIDLESTSYSLSFYPGALTLWQADGASSILSLDALESINAAVGIGGTEVNFTIEAANGGLIDVSNVTSLTGAISNDWLRFHLHDGGVLNFASLNTTTGRTRFDLDQAYTLPSLQSTTSTVFELAPGITASMPSLSTFRSGFFVPETGSTFSAPLLANFTDSSLNLDGTWTFSTSQPLLDIDDSFIVATNGQTLTVADPAYNLTHYPGESTLLKADGAGSALGLSSATSINAATGIGGAEVNFTIEASNGGAIDLSGVSSLTGAISNDWLRFKINTGGSLDLTSLQTVTGRTRFDIDQFFTLPALETISSSRFELGSFTTFNTPQLASFHGGAITGESGAEYNAAKLLSFTDSQLAIDSTWQFNVPLFEDIDNSFITVNDGESFAVADTSYNITHYPGEVTLMRSDGSGSLLDLSSVASVSAAVGTGGGAVNYTIEANNNGTIDLSGTSTIAGATSNDWLRFVASQGGDLELGAVSASGRAYFRVSDNNSKMRFASLRLAPPVYLEALLSGSVLIASTLEGVGNPSVILDQADFGSMTIGTGPEETTLNTIRVHADGAIQGDITLSANLVNGGTVSPGTPNDLVNQDLISLNGDFTQLATGTYQVASNGNDILTVSGDAHLHGALTVLAEGIGGPGSEVTILTAAAVTGSFASSNASALGLIIDYQPDRVVLRVAADTDLDGLPDLWETANIGDLTEDGADDHDNDGLTNAEELAQFTDPDSADSDMDGLDDGDEVNTHGTDPRVADSDSDGLNDGAEINSHGTNPNLADSDGDGLDDGTEVNTHGSNPTLADSDLDGVDDGVEVGRGGHPTDPGITPLWQTQTSLFTGGDPGEGLDFSGVFPYAVNMRGSGGFTIDDASFTDDSGITFSAPSEILNWHLPEYGSSTRDNDLETVMQSIRYSTGIITLDLPGLDPGYSYKLQLLFAESTSNRGFDVEAEGFTIVDDLNPGQEQGGINITNNGVVVSHTFEALDSVLNLRLTDDVPFPDDTPVLFGFTLENLGPIDSDGDGLPDRWELEHFGNLAQGAADNPDNDGLDNAAELSQGTDPDDADSDDDTLTDGDEVLTHGTNPLEPDSDFDGFDDNTELVNGTSPTDFYDQPTVIPVTDATYTGPTNPGLYDNPANWDINAIPLDAVNARYHSIINSAGTVNLSDITPVNGLVTGLTMSSNTTLQLGPNDQLVVDIPVNIDGRITSSGSNALFRSQGGGGTFNDAKLFVNTAGVIDLESTSYALSSYPGPITLWQADGASSILSLDALESINTPVGIGGTEVDFTIEAANGGLIDVSNVSSVSGAISNDWLRFHIHDGGSLNFASLNAITGRTRFDLDQAYTLPSLQSTTSTVFELASGITASMPSLSTFRSGSFVPEVGSTFNAPLLANFTDSSLNLDGTWNFTTLQPLLDIDDSFIVATNGQTLTVADPAYNLTHYPGESTLLKADGAGSALDLSSAASINAATGIGGAEVNFTIEASNGGAIDLSGVSSLTGAISNDWLRFKLNTGGFLDLTSLQTVTGRTIFDIDQFYSLPTLQSVSSTRFELGSFTTFTTPQLESFHGGAITGESGSEYNASKLLSFTDSQVTIDSTWQFNVPLFEDIDNSFITVNDGESFAVADTNYNITHYPGEVTLMRSDGSGSLLDLSSVAGISAAVGVGGTEVSYTIEAANNGTIDLSGTNSITGATSNDWLRFVASQGGDLELGDVDAAGRAYFRVSDNNSKLRFASLRLAPPVYLEAQLSGSVLIDSILEGVDNPSVILDQANFGSMTIGTGPEETTLNTIRVHADGTIQGDITLSANLANGGTVSPGASHGTISLSGDYTQLPEGKYEVGVGDRMPLQTELSDKLVISGQAGLAGHLEVVLEGTLQPGTDYVIITASTVSGIFASSNAPDFGLVVVYEPTRVLLRLDVDTDGDGLPDIQEGLLGTNPNLSDTDGDSIPDGWEHRHGSDPLVDDAGLDSDGNGLSNLRDYQLSLDLELHYTFDGEAGPLEFLILDSTFNSRHGIANGVPNRSPLAAGGDATLCFDGTNDSVSAPPFELGGEITFAGWVQFEEFNSWSRVFDFGNGFPDNNIVLGNQATSGDLSIQYWNGGTMASASITDFWNLNRWLHVGVSIDSAGTIKIYKNGQLELTHASGVLLPTVTRQQALIGKSNWITDGPFEGKMDDFRIYSRELSSTDISDLYDARASRYPLLEDADGDFLPDDWEAANDLDPLDDGSIDPDNGANGDPDGDLLTNIEEFYWGRDPQSSDSECLVAIERVAVSGEVTLTFDVIPGRLYQICVGNEPDSLIPVGSAMLFGTPGSHTWSDDGTETGFHPSLDVERFYKVQVSLPR